MQLYFKIFEFGVIGGANRTIWIYFRVSLTFFSDVRSKN